MTLDNDNDVTVKMFLFKVDMPPSENNNIWVNPKTGRVILKDTVRKWKADANLMLSNLQPQEQTDWHLELNFVFHYVKTPRRFDTQNRLKHLIDAIANRLNIDDSRLYRFIVTKTLKQGKDRDYVEGSVTLL